jgi:hypothetical protein
MYSGEFSFEQPGAGLATPPPEVTIPETPEQKAVTLYGPSGEIANLMLPKDQQKYDELVSQGYGISAPQVVQQQDDTTSNRVLEEIKTSESSRNWMDDYSYQDSDKLLAESLNALEPTKGFGKIFEGGAMGQIMKASNAAQVAANLRVLRSQGVSEVQLQPLQDRLDKYVSDNAFGDLLPDSWYDGSEFYKDLQDAYGEDFTKQVVKPQGKYSPTATTEAKGFTKNILSKGEQKTFDNAVDKGDTALVNHFVAINRLRNKKDAYAEILKTQGEAAASTYAQATNMSYYDIKDATTYGGSQQTAINQGRAEKGGFFQNAKLIDRMKTGTNPKEEKPAASASQTSVVTSELNGTSLANKPEITPEKDADPFKHIKEIQEASRKAAEKQTSGASNKYVGRTDSSGKKLAEAGYKSALRERKEKEKAAKDAGATRGPGGEFGMAKGGLMKKKKNKK